MIEKVGILSPMKTQISVSLADLRYVSIHCPGCRTVVTLDMKKPSEFSKTHDMAFCPAECPGCREKYDTAIRPAVTTFQKSYESLVEIADRISFSGTAEDSD